MKAVEITLVADNQTFATTIDGSVYHLSVIWRGEYWVLDLADSNGSAIISGIPMITGADLLAQYRYMDLDLELQHLQSTLETDYDDHDGTCSHYPDSYIIYIFHFDQRAGKFGQLVG